MAVAVVAEAEAAAAAAPVLVPAMPAVPIVEGEIGTFYVGFDSEFGDSG